MNYFKFLSGFALLKLALGISIVAIGYLTTMFFFQVQDLNSSFNKIEDINKTLINLESLNSKLAIDETKIHFLIKMNRLDQLEVNFSEHVQFQKEIYRLKNLEDIKLNHNLDKLFFLIKNRYNIIQNLSFTNKFKSDDVIKLKELIDKCHNVDAEIKNVISNILQQEKNSILIQNLNFEKKLTYTRNTVLLIALVSILIFLLSYNKMNDHIYNLKKTNDELKIVNEIFRTSEEIASFGYWKYNLDTKKFTYSKNLYKIFQVSPESFDENEYSILKFLHPDDVKNISEIHQESILSKQPVSLFYRILMPNGDIKYMSTISSFTKNGRDEDVKIVVIQDITELYKSNLELQQINDRLLFTNSELESFNNIVSHDLQEPLRKIQMFVSKFSEADLAIISDKGREILNKIQISSNRMQNLMIDMVNYARTIKEDKILVEINLNQTISDIYKRLSISLEEIDARFQYQDLPIIEGIPFQINQLFENIISNSIKYRQPNQQLYIQILEIDIFNDIVNELADLDVSPKKSISNKNYTKIVIIDNGIGFNSDYSHNIFQLFKRLESSKKYNGTGIGLAICKKIIENHNGYIKAESQISKGSIFSIYLPKYIK